MHNCNDKIMSASGSFMTILANEQIFVHLRERFAGAAGRLPVRAGKILEKIYA